MISVDLQETPSSLTVCLLDKDEDEGGYLKLN